MRISDWSSDVCSSDLEHDESDIDDGRPPDADGPGRGDRDTPGDPGREQTRQRQTLQRQPPGPIGNGRQQKAGDHGAAEAEDHLVAVPGDGIAGGRSEEHTSELQSLMRISYAVFCLKKKKPTTTVQQ